MASKDLTKATAAAKAKATKTGRPQVLSIAPAGCNHGVMGLHTFSPARQAQILGGGDPTCVVIVPGL